jgi:hypothetical protein
MKARGHFWPLLSYLVTTQRSATVRVLSKMSYSTAISSTNHVQLQNRTMTR